MIQKNTLFIGVLCCLTVLNLCAFTSRKVRDNRFKSSEKVRQNLYNAHMRLAMRQQRKLWGVDFEDYGCFLVVSLCGVSYKPFVDTDYIKIHKDENQKNTSIT